MARWSENRASNHAIPAQIHLHISTDVRRIEGRLWRGYVHRHVPVTMVTLVDTESSEYGRNFEKTNDHVRANSAYKMAFSDDPHGGWEQQRCG